MNDTHTYIYIYIYMTHMYIYIYICWIFQQAMFDDQRVKGITHQPVEILWITGDLTSQWRISLRIGWYDDNLNYFDGELMVIYGELYNDLMVIYIVIWVCLKMLCTPLYPMVLLIIIPMKNGYFIGNINPTFSDKAKSQVSGPGLMKPWWQKSDLGIPKIFK